MKLEQSEEMSSIYIDNEARLDNSNFRSTKGHMPRVQSSLKGLPLDKERRSFPYAPVLISCYSRPDFLARACEHLARCEGAKETHVYIYSDAANANDTTQDIDAIVREVRDYVLSLGKKGLFASVTLMAWAFNKGSHESFAFAQDYLYERYDRLIIFEDDIMVGRGFLRYMSEALELYKDDPRVYEIASHSFPEIVRPHTYPHEVYLLNAFNPWGCGMMRKWHHAFDIRDIDHAYTKGFLANKELVAKAKKTIPHLVPMLRKMLREETRHGDALLCMYMIENDLYMVAPFENLSINIGFDERSEHCKEGSESIINQRLHHRAPRLPAPSELAFSTGISAQYEALLYDYKSQVLIPFLERLYLYKPLRFIYQNTVKKLLIRR